MDTKDEKLIKKHIRNTNTIIKQYESLTKDIGWLYALLFGTFFLALAAFVHTMFF